MNELKRILQALDRLHRDKKAMAPMPAGAAKGAAGKTGAGAKGSGSGNQGNQQGGASQSGGGTGGDMGGDIKNPQTKIEVDQHEAKIEQLRQKEDAVKQDLAQINDWIDQVKDQIDYAQNPGQKQQLQQQLKQYEEAKSNIKRSISEVEQEIEVEKQAISNLKPMVGKERAANIAIQTRNPYAMAAGMAAKKVIGKMSGEVEQNTGEKEQRLEGKEAASEQNTQRAEEGAKSAGAQAGAGSSPQKTKTVVKMGGTGSTGGSSGGRFMPGSFGGIGGSGSSADVPKWKYFIVILIIAMAGAFYKVATAVTLRSMLPFILLLLAVLISISFKGKMWTLIVLVMLAVGVWLFISSTLPQFMGSWSAGNVAEAGEETVETAETGIKAWWDNTMDEWNKQTQIASGEYMSGEVDKTESKSAGMEIRDPYISNPTEIFEGDILDISAVIKAFDPKTPVTVQVSCHLQRTETGSLISQEKVGGGVVLFAGEGQEVYPKYIEVPAATEIEKEVTCYPSQTYNEASGFQDIYCGDYRAYISSQIDNLRTDAELFNYLMDEDTVIQEIKTYAEENRLTETDVESIVMKRYPELEQAQSVSVSQKGSIKVLMETQRAPLITIEQDESLKLRAGIENTLAGWIRELNSFQIEIVFEQPIQIEESRCKGWEWDGQFLRLTEDYIKTVNNNLKTIAKGHQKIFPSCQLKIPDVAAMNSPRAITFLASADYDYIMQEEYSIDVLNETGGNKCPDRDLPTSESEASTGAGSESSAGEAGTGATDTQTDQDISNDPGVLACEGKTQGDSCGPNQYCSMIEGDKYFCFPECLYNAIMEQEGLTQDYNCLSSEIYCVEGTVVDQSCFTSHLVAGESQMTACCIPK